MMLIRSPADTTESREDMLPRHERFVEATGRRGKLVDGAELADVTTATTLRRQGNDTIVTDGPHAETKEHLGGYYLIDCADLDEAIEIGREVPLVDGATLEIRPLVEH
ncbi:MAG: YciI family protein [Candidatus Dormibacteraeota bacterium]|nr:YciI family protein [Candidatus Dormibacteraeota bacterium]